MSMQGKGRRKTRRGVKIALFLSLAVNLLVAGLIVGAITGHRFDGDQHPTRFDRAGGPMTAALSHQDRRAIGRQMREAGRAQRPSRADIRAEYEAVIAALTAETYDHDTVRNAVERQVTAAHSRAELGASLLLERLQGMTAEERSAFAERLREVVSRRTAKAPKGRHGGWSGPFGRY